MAFRYLISWKKPPRPSPRSIRDRKHEMNGAMIVLTWNDYEDGKVFKRRRENK